jgi:peroxiredoxin Q/BCP
LRLEYEQFTKRGTEIIVLGPDGPNAFRRYWEENDMPFIGMADIKSRIAGQYDQEVNLLKFGRMPAVFVIDSDGIIRYSHYAQSMSDLPPNQQLFDVIDQINEGTRINQPIFSIFY